MKLCAFIFTILILPFSAIAQTEGRDSIAIYYPHSGNNLNDTTNLYYNFDKKYAEVNGLAYKNAFTRDTVFLMPADLDIAPTPGIASLASWSTGSIYAAGGIRIIPGIMAINLGSIHISQNFGQLSVDAYAVANKYGYFRGQQTSYGVGGALTYRFSDKLSATLFGEYHSPVNIYQPAMAGYVSIPRFGGYVDSSFSSKFGVEVGVQGYRSMMTQRIEAQPIIKPYFRLSKDSKIGIDFGGILYQMLNCRRSQYNQSRNPTIGPPVQKLSQTMGY